MRDVRRCIYCGHKCKGRTCMAHADLPALDYHGAVKS